MSEKKRICLVIPGLNAGGMERVMSELAHYFSQKENIETFFILYTKGEEFYKVPENVTLITPDFYFNKGKRVQYTIKTLFFLRKEIKKIKPDAVLSFGETYNSFVLLALMFLKTKVFVSDRSKPDKPWGIFHENLRRVLYKRAEGIVSQTTYSREFLQKETGHKNIAVIPNPVKSFTKPSPLKNNVILTVGRLIATKRFDLLLQVFSQISEKDWSLWIVGDGPERKNLEGLALELGLSEKVKFWGFQKDIETFYRRSGVFAFTSVSEGFPNALLEAFAAGLPCISFDCVAGPSDLIKNGENGFLIPLLDVSAFESHLKILLNDENLRISMGQKAFATSKEYDLEKIGDAYLNFLLK